MRHDDNSADSAPPDSLLLEPHWPALLAAARRARSTGGAETMTPVDSPPDLPATADAGALLAWDAGAGWVIEAEVDERARELIELYLPVASASASRPCIVAHLGQSLDGFIATASGDSFFVTGEENITHLHRMRALSDAVIVGAETARLDNPRLTTRQVEGEHPVRVVLDPTRRLDPSLTLFHDRQAPTLLVCCEELAGEPLGAAHCEVVGLPCRDGRVDLRALVDALASRGLHVLFVEGGGSAVSAFLAAGLLDRLQVAVAPVLIGGGRPGVRLPSASRMSDCLRPDCRLVRFGDDVLFDCDVRGFAAG